MYNMLGQVTEILEEATLDPGSYTTEWNADTYPEATYVLKVMTEEACLVRKVISMTMRNLP